MLLGDCPADASFCGGESQRLRAQLSFSSASHCFFLNITNSAEATPYCHSVAFSPAIYLEGDDAVKHCLYKLGKLLDSSSLTVHHPFCRVMAAAVSRSQQGLTDDQLEALSGDFCFISSSEFASPASSWTYLPGSNSLGSSHWSAAHSHIAHDGSLEDNHGYSATRVQGSTSQEPVFTIAPLHDTSSKFGVPMADNMSQYPQPESLSSVQNLPIATPWARTLAVGDEVSSWQTSGIGEILQPSINHPSVSASQSYNASLGCSYSSDAEASAWLNYEQKFTFMNQPNLILTGPTWSIGLQNNGDHNTLSGVGPTNIPGGLWDPSDPMTYGMGSFDSFKNTIVPLVWSEIPLDGITSASNTDQCQGHHLPEVIAATAQDQYNPLHFPDRGIYPRVYHVGKGSKVSKRYARGPAPSRTSPVTIAPKLPNGRVPSLKDRQSARSAVREAGKKVLRSSKSQSTGYGKTKNACWICVFQKVRG